jgi:DNA polymerase III epsilon subunit-like protein
VRRTGGWSWARVRALGAGVLAARAAWAARRRARGGGAPLQDLDFVAIDTETTGLDPQRDALVSLAAIPFVRGVPRPELGCTAIVNPGRPIPAAAQAIHGIGEAEVRDAPEPARVLPAFFAVCGARPLVAHTAHFDLAVIGRAARAAGLGGPRGPVLDVGLLAHALFPSWWDLSLEGLGRLVEIEPVARHTADGDAITAGLIFLRMAPRLADRGVTTLRAALSLQRRAGVLPGGPGVTGAAPSGP